MRCNFSKTIGCTAMPINLVSKVNSGQSLTPAEQTLYDTHPTLGGQLLRNIPRLEKVAEIISLQDKYTDTETPIGARVIHLAKRYDIMLCSGSLPHEITTEIRKDETYYGPKLLDVFEELISRTVDSSTVTLPISSLKKGMIVDQDVLTHDNLLLINKGQELTEASILRLFNYGNSCGVKEPIEVLLQNEELG